MSVNNIFYSFLTDVIYELKEKERYMESDRIKWNQRFDSPELYLGSRPSPFLLQEIDRIISTKPGKVALDIACGEGRNSVFLAQQGFRVTGMDISELGLAKAAAVADQSGVQIEFIQKDLDGYFFEKRYDLILNFNFLMRDLIPSMIQALTPGGLLLFDALLASSQLPAFQSHKPAYLLQRGELHDIFTTFEGNILVTEECDLGTVHTARLLFRKIVSVETDHV
jgi:2-polyprenyl-3-methyl-5-hydroxy-6-metoxy-1,4-benzoquinol methylase